MRPICFIGMLVAGVVLPWWLVLPLGVWYACMFRAYELIVLGVALDAYFGSALPWHVLYTATAGVVCAGAEFLKPRMAWYETSE